MRRAELLLQQAQAHLSAIIERELLNERLAIDRELLNLGVIGVRDRAKTEYRPWPAAAC